MSGVRFIRKNGRLIPIREKGGSNAKAQKSEAAYKKYDNARVEKTSKAFRKTGSVWAGAGAGIGVALASRGSFKKQLVAGFAAGAIGAIIGGGRAASKAGKNFDRSKQGKKLGSESRKAFMSWHKSKHRNKSGV